MKENKRDPMISGDFNTNDNADTSDWNDVRDFLASADAAFYSDLLVRLSNENMDDRRTNECSLDIHHETTMEADAVEDPREAVTIRMDDFEADTSQVSLAVNNEALVAPRVRNELAPKDDSILKRKPSVTNVTITHPEMLPIGDLNFKALFVSNNDDEVSCCYWRGKNRLYAVPGKAFAIRFMVEGHNAVKIVNQSHIEIYPVYEDENRSHVPVFRSNEAVPAALGVVEVLKGAAGEDIEGMGGRRGLRLSATVAQVTLCLYQWDNHDSKRKHLPVALHFIMYDSKRRCRGRDCMQVRVHMQPKRKRRDDKKKLELNTMETAQQTIKPEPGSKAASRPALKRPRRARTYDSDDEPLVKRALVPPTIKLQLELPKTRDVENILESLRLTLEQTVRHSQTPDCHILPLYKRSIQDIGKIQSQGNFNK